MGILSKLFGLDPKEEKLVVAKVPAKPMAAPTVKESLTNLAIEVIGASERTALIPLQEDNISAKYSELVKLGLKNSANAKVLKKQLDNINNYNNTILKAQEEDDMLKFLATQINFDCIFFFDEYEKEFKESSSVLSFMDGVHNSQYRKIFLLTTNELEINSNLLGRPSRIRYVRSFGNLPEETTLELLNDILIDKSSVEPVLDLIRQMQIITVDLVKALAQEVNIHGVDKIDMIRKNFNLEFSDFTYLVEYMELETDALNGVQNIDEQLFEKIIKSREITRKIVRKPISELTEEELDAKSAMAGIYIRTDSVSIHKEIKYLKIGEDFDGCPIFYIDPKKRYVVTCYNHFIIYVIKSGYSTNASGKFNQVY